MNRIIYLLILTIFLVSCASLSKTQIKTVNHFAQTTKDFSAFPGKIMTGLAEIRTRRGVYFANSLSDPKLHIDVLDSIYSNKIHAYKVSEKVDITFKIINKYAQSLELLSSDRYEIKLKDQATSFGLDIDSLVILYNNIDKTGKLPTGIGAAVGKLVIMGGQQYFRAKQAKEIKSFVHQADTLISTMTGNLLVFLKSENINELINAEERGINENYLSYIRQTSKTSIENDYEYLELKNSIDEVKKLRQQTITATRNLRETHKKLLIEIEKKKVFKESLKELQLLFEQIKELKSIADNIKNPKQ
jgi:hypothetical protein